MVDFRSLIVKIAKEAFEKQVQQKSNLNEQSGILNSIKNRVSQFGWNKKAQETIGTTQLAALEFWMSRTVKIRLSSKSANAGRATAILLNPNLVVTNKHVV